MAARKQQTIDPQQINDPAEIPPQGAHPVGLSPQGLVDVYCGTIPGDTGAQPSAKELLGPAPDTGGLANADYIYKQVSKLYGGAELPAFKSPSGNDVKALVFVSGSSQGSYGAFHLNIPGDQADFDKIVLDSLDVSAHYKAGLIDETGRASEKEARGRRTGLLTPHHGPADLLTITHAGDPRLKAAKPADIRCALTLGAQSIRALTKIVETRNASAAPGEREHTSRGTKEEPIHQLTRMNRDLQALVRAAVGGSTGRQYLSTALFTAELVESFQTLTKNADPGKTDGEAVSRIVGYKLAPEISLIPGFNALVVQQWWQDGHQDFVNDNSQDDLSADGNGAGVMFLQFLNDYLGVPLGKIIEHMPKKGGAPLGQTYVNLLRDDSSLASAAGDSGDSAFRKMVSLLETIQISDGSLDLPANGNPFPAMPNAKQGGLFEAGAGGSTPVTGSLAQDTQGSLTLLTQVEQQITALRSQLEQVQRDLTPNPNAIHGERRAHPIRMLDASKDFYGPPLGAPIVTKIEQQVASYRAPQYDETLRQDFWPHVYNELPGSGTRTNRLQVISGTIQSPEAVQITGTIMNTTPEKDGDLHISFQPDDPKFPANHASPEPPLEIEIIYAGPVSQNDARKAGQGYHNPFDIAPLKPGTRVQVAGPLIFDTAHGRVNANGDVEYGLEIHPAVSVTLLSDGPISAPPPPPNGNTLSTDLASALNQAGALAQSVTSLTALVQKMKGEAPTG